MNSLPDDILLHIFVFIPFVQRIKLRTVSRRWNRLLLDSSLMRKISIIRRSCEDDDLLNLFSAATRLEEVSVRNSYAIEGYCILFANIGCLRKLDLTGCAIGDDILQKILERCRDHLRELMLAGTNITSRCLPEIKSLSQLNNIVVPRERTSFTKEGVVDIVRNCPNLRSLSCEEGYSFSSHDIVAIVEVGPMLSTLLIPFSRIDDQMLTSVVQGLRNLQKLCVCETGVTSQGVRAVRDLKPQLEICWNENCTP